MRRKARNGGRDDANITNIRSEARTKARPKHGPLLFRIFHEETRSKSIFIRDFVLNGTKISIGSEGADRAFGPIIEIFSGDLVDLVE